MCINFFFYFRYVSLLSEHHRIIFCGPSGTGKSYLSNKLAEFLVMKMGKECNDSTIVTFRFVQNYIFLIHYRLKCLI